MRYVVVDVDEFQFVIADLNGSQMKADVPDGSGLPDDADEFLAVSTGAHSGQARVGIAVHAAAPAADLHDWDAAAEASVRVAGGLAVTSLFGDGPEVPELEELRGDYRVRVLARGRDASAAAFDYDKPARRLAEEFEIHVWPEPFGPGRTLKESDEACRAHRGDVPEVDLENEPYAAEAVVAVARIAAALKRPQPGPHTGTATASAEISAAPRVAFGKLRTAYGWLTDHVQPPEAEVPGAAFVLLDGHAGYSAECRYERIELHTRLVLRWLWRAASEEAGAAWYSRPAVVSAVEFGVRPAGGARAEVTVTHTGLPQDWAGDVETYWRRQLQRLETIVTTGFAGLQPGATRWY